MFLGDYGLESQHPILSEYDKSEVTRRLVNEIVKQFAFENVTDSLVNTIKEYVKNSLLIKTGERIGRIWLTKIKFVPGDHICEVEYEINWFTPID